MVSSHLKEKQNTKPTPKSSVVSGFQANQRQNQNPGQRIAPPYKKSPNTCKKCGVTLERNVNHTCAKPVYGNCSAEWESHDNHEYNCDKVKAKAAAAGKSLLGTVDEL